MSHTPKSSDSASEKAVVVGNPALERAREEKVMGDIEHLHGPEEVLYGPNELVLICLVRDGEPWVRDFMEHHFALGVKHVVLLDNGSEDDTIKRAREYDNVTILRTTMPFKTHKESIRRYALRRFGKNRWILYMDIDEMFDYPYSDVVGVESLLEYLNRERYTAVVTQTMEMFPEDAMLGAIEDTPGRIKEQHRFYDLSGLREVDYLHYRENKDRLNTVSNEKIKVYRGGIQTILSGHQTTSTRHTLVFMDDEIEPMTPSVHWVRNAHIADFTGAILHYRFTSDFHERVVRAVREEAHGGGSSKYKKYLTVLDETPDIQIKQETSKELHSVNDLVDDGFLTVSEDYMVWVDEKESENPSPEVLRERPTRLGEAFSRARSRRTVELGGAGKIEEYVKDLEDGAEAQRERVERLTKRNQNLTRQWRRLQNSGDFKLLRKAASIRSRLLAKLPFSSR